MMSTEQENLRNNNMEIPGDLYVALRYALLDAINGQLSEYRAGDLYRRLTLAYFGREAIGRVEEGGKEKWMWVLKLLDAEAGGEYLFGPFLTVEEACELAGRTIDSLVYRGGVVLEIHSPNEIVGLDACTTRGAAHAARPS